MHVRVTDHLPIRGLDSFLCRRLSKKKKESIPDKLAYVWISSFGRSSSLSLPQSRVLIPLTIALSRTIFKNSYTN